MCAYYRQFIATLSFIARPLHDLYKNNVRFAWIDKQNYAFEKLKEKIISQPLSNLSKPSKVQCDACGNSLGALLLQEGHAKEYESCRLNKHERYLGIYEKELLAMMHAPDTWKHYLLDTPFIWRTDHQSLKYFKT